MPAFLEAPVEPAAWLALLTDLPADAGGAERFERLFQSLADAYSRATLFHVLAYRYRSIRALPHADAYLKARADLAGGVRQANSYLGYGGFGAGNIGAYEAINLYDLDHFGVPLRLHGDAHSLVCTFLLGQYRYHHGGVTVAARAGDIVIDAGAFVGDTALYFSREIGPEGRVFAFEANPYSLGICRENLHLNPGAAANTALVERVLWRRSGETFALVGDLNNAHLVAPDATRRQSPAVTSVALDDFVAERRLDRVDFIKMDIEGAELPALQGAEQVLRAQRPRLAIAVYHRPADLVEIPDYLAGLGLGYRFYLDHFTDRGFETILFAVPGDGGGTG